MQTEKKQYAWIPLLLFLFLFTGCGKEKMHLRSVGDDTEKEVSVSEEAGSDQGQETDEQNPAGYPDGKTETDQGTQESTEQTVTVYVCGAVMEEGVYTLPQGSRVEEALARAGGYRDDAARGYINLAEPLIDGEMLRFPTEEEIQSGSFSQEGASPEGKKAPGDGKINLNTATREELLTLPGIGEKKAEDILVYREENGGFSDIRELMNISGIKEGVFEKLKDLVKIEGYY